MLKKIAAMKSTLWVTKGHWKMEMVPFESLAWFLISISYYLWPYLQQFWHDTQTWQTPAWQTDRHRTMAKTDRHPPDRQTDTARWQRLHLWLHMHHVAKNCRSNETRISHCKKIWPASASSSSLTSSRPQTTTGSEHCTPFRTADNTRSETMAGGKLNKRPY